MAWGGLRPDSLNSTASEKEVVAEVVGKGTEPSHWTGEGKRRARADFLIQTLGAGEEQEAREGHSGKSLPTAGVEVAAAAVMREAAEGGEGEGILVEMTQQARGG